MFKRSEFLKFSPPAVGQEEIEEVIDALRSGWLSTGPRARRFEEQFKAYTGAPGALGLNSCTAALHVALKTLGIGPGDEVVTTPMTFCASVNVIEHVGAKPVLVDVEPDTLNIDPAKVAAAVTSKTKAIIPVHFAGHPVELDPILEIASSRGLEVIEDAAHAIPAKYKGRMIGSGKNPVAFSFYATKNLTTSEGGLLTGTPEFLDRARVVSLHGMSRDAWKRYDKGGSWKYEVLLPGFKYNLTDIQASIGIVQLKRLGEMQARREQIVARYHADLAAIGGLDLPVTRPHVEHAWHLYAIRLRAGEWKIGRDQFIDELTERNIGTSVHFIPVHMHPYYRDKYSWKPNDFPVANSEFERIISLPLSPAHTDRDIDDVIEAIADIRKTFGR